MYIDLLDSTKSGHPFQSGVQEDWWRANTTEQQHQAVSIAQAAMMIRLLYGETIVLTHHQIFDSYAWLSACENFVGAAPALPFVPVTWSVYTYGSASPEGFIDTAVKIFRPTGKFSFKLSAWPSLDAKLREKIAQNLERDRSFKGMYKDVWESLDSSLKDKYTQQQTALIKFHEYLLQHHRQSIPWTPNTPTVIKNCDLEHPRSIWTLLNTVRDHPKGIPGEVLDEIQAQIAGVENGRSLAENLEVRSFLYLAISELDAELRDRIRKLIDFCYNLKTGQSASPVCLYSVLDQDQATPPSEDSELLDFIENEYFGTDSANDVLLFHPGQFKELSTLRFDDCIRILGLPQIQLSLQTLRNHAQAYPGKQAGYYQETHWLEQMDALVLQHNTLLAKNLTGKVAVGKNGMLMALMPALAVTAAVGGDVVSYYAGSTAGILTSTLIALLGSLTPLLAQKIDPLKIPTSAASRIFGRLQSSVTPHRAKK